MDPATLRDLSDGIERLLTEVRAVAGPVAWPRVEQLLSSVVQLYGAGLARVLESVDDTMRAKLSEDELIASLLVLHGLHPLGPEARIRRALEQMVPQAKLVGLDEGVARLSVANAGPGLAEALSRLVQEVAPEVSRVEVLAEPLVQIDLARTRARKGL